MPSFSYMVLLALITVPALAGKTPKSFHFERVSTLYGGDIFQFSVSPSNIIYCASPNGIFFSSDQGLHWHQAGNVNARSPQRAGNEVYRLSSVFASSDSSVLAGGWEGFVASTDRGASWHLLSTIGTDAFVRVDSVTMLSSRYRTTNRGVTWSIMPSFGADAYGLMSDGTLFGSSWLGGLYRSDDTGKTWQKLPPDTASVPAVAVLGNLLFIARNPGSILRSTDRGMTWETLEAPVPHNCYFNSLFVNPRKNIIYVASTQPGCLRSLDSGKTWQRLTVGLPNHEVLSYVLDSLGMLFAGLRGVGVYRSTDDGEHWERASTGITATENYALGADNRNNVYLGIWSAGLFKTSNNGGSWLLVSPDTGMYSNWFTFAADPAGTVYAAGDRSTDGGNSWQEVFHLGPTTITVDTAGHVYAAADGLYKSIDRGTHWQLLSTYNVFMTACYSSAVNPMNGHLFFSNGAYGLWRSTDEGITWQTTTPAAARYNNIFVTAKGTVLYTVGRSGVYRSDDDGTRFYTYANNGLPENDLRGADKIAEGPDGTIFISFNSSVYYSTDEGSFWHPAAPSPFSSVIRCIAVNSSGYLFVGTDSAMYRTTRPAVITDADQVEAIPRQHALFQNYPNPFNPTTNIGYRIADFGFVSLKIYNTLGQQVATLVNEVKPPGSYSVTWNAGNNPSGMYFYKLSAGRFVEVKKMVLVR